ncbi:hypothetical protein SASPL_152178 [Salvia splendens]|uniref:Uncharacterized protein n=1 Tax=Salvia splendens TaxID=180675 RepID=A0A8X8Z032_SALSN|nr:hypothetical protein SASPL_152178 [Salvia splendens]
MQHLVEDPDKATMSECTTVVRQLMYIDTLDQFDSSYTTLTQRTNSVSRIRSTCSLRSLDEDEKEGDGNDIYGSGEDSAKRVSP